MMSKSDADWFKKVGPGAIMAVPMTMQEFHLMSTPEYIDEKTVKMIVKFAQYGRPETTAEGFIAHRYVPLEQNTNPEEELVMVYDDDLFSWKKKSSTPVTKEPDNAVIRIFSAVQEKFEKRPDPATASLAIYVVSLAAAKLGKDKPEEAKLFKERWARMKTLLEPLSDAIELLSNGKLIDDLIDQALNDKFGVNLDSLPAPANRQESTLAEQERNIISYL